MISELFTVCICGGRRYRATVADAMFLDALHAIRPFTTVMHGGATGADAFAYSWAIRRQIPVRTVRAEWKQHGRAAGPLRNRHMARAADAVIAFPGGPGTDSMVQCARDEGVPIIFPRYAGSQ